MSLAIIDAREWQNRFDLETGQPLDDSHPVVSMVSRVLRRNPYPGDVDEKANQWVSQTALDLIHDYAPDLVCLSYVQQFFAARHSALTPEALDDLCVNAMAEAMHFIAASGYTPVIIGTGGLMPLKGEMDLSMLDGLAVSANWSARYCGIHRPSRADMDRLEYLRDLGRIERLVSKEEWIHVFREVQPDLTFHQDMDLMPDFLAVAAEGFSFRTTGTTLRKPVHVPENNFRIPVFTPLGRVDDLREIKTLVRSSLGHRKTALILVEGVGEKHFPADRFLCGNGAGWFCYEPGDAFYLTLSTGKHEPFAYPAGFRYFDRNEEHIRFPFSGYLNFIPQNTLAMDYPGRSIAVGNRSMFMHMMFGVDISVECFARNLFNQGLMGVVHRKDKL